MLTKTGKHRITSLMTLNKRKNNRETSLDILRGIAVCTMVLAHVIAFLYKDENRLLKGLQYFGGTVSFTVFLLVSGAVSYLAYMHIPKDKWSKKRTNLLRRALRLLVGYYIVAIISTLQDFPLPPDISWINNILKIIFFIKVPGYTEFILPFIFFSLVIVIFRNTIKALLEDKLFLLLVGILAYNIGFLIYNIHIPSLITPFTALLAGYLNWYRFPILQYTPIFLLGLFTGETIKSDKSHNKKFIIFFSILALSLIFLITSFIAKPLAQFPYIEEFQRWPPTISFLSVGLLFSYIILSMFQIRLNISVLQPIKRIFILLGKSAFSIYISHIIILQVINLLFEVRLNSLIAVLIALFLLLGICLGIVTLSRLIRLKCDIIAHS